MPLKTYGQVAARSDSIFAFRGDKGGDCWAGGQ